MEALYAEVTKQWKIAVLFAAWCQLRRGECLGLQRRDIEFHADGSATLYVRRQLNANTGDYADLQSDAAGHPMSVPAAMLQRLIDHMRDFVAPEMKAPLVPASPKGTVPLSNTRGGTVRTTVCEGPA